jgi:acyl transferase domain-containing protein/pimeloyl-ACP methyl ester carboxylesterase
MTRRALRFGRAQHLIGVIHEPQAARQSYGVLLWNTGISHRAGPYRLNVEVGEHLASRGFTVMRFDLSRLGDSDDKSDETDFQERNTRDIEDAITVLFEQYSVQKVILIGLCSSAVDAYYCARQDPRIAGLVMVDTFVFPTFRHRVTYFLQRLVNAHRWKRYLYRRLVLPFQNKESIPYDYFEGNYPSPAQARRDIESLLNQGTELLVIYTGGFGAYFSHPTQFASMLGAPAFRQHFEIQVWPQTDHLFTMIEDRMEFLKTIDTWFSKHFNRETVAPPAIPIQEATPSAFTAQAPHTPTVANPTKHPGEELTAKGTPFQPQLSARPEISSELILDTFRRILHAPDLREDDNFFEFGGTSLLATRATATLSEALKLEVSVLDLYEFPSAKHLAHGLQHARTDGIIHPATPHPPSTSIPPSSQTDDEAIALIGMACHVPGAKTWQDFWSMVLEGREAIRRFHPEELDTSLPQELRAHPHYVTARGMIEGDRFDAQFFKINRKEALFTDPQQRILLETCWQALEDAGYSHVRQQHRVAVYAGVGQNTYLSRNIMAGHAVPHSEEEYLAFLTNDKDYVATRIAYALDLQGPAVSVHTACSTSLVAVIEAIKALRCGDADLAVAGAASVHAPMASGHMYQQGSLFSRDGHCRPFSSEATGTMFSDGSAVVVLKRLSDALRDHDHVYAVIRGWGLNNDGSGKSSFAAPSVKGQATAIQAALHRAQWTARSISYVECHGTATPIGDPIEMEGLRRAFRETTAENQFCAIGSVKANIGHLTAAAGTIGLMKAALAVRFGRIPPALHAMPQNPALQLEQSPFFIPTELMPWRGPGPRRAAVSSFGVGGTNAHVLLESAPVHEVPSLKTELRADPWIVVPWSAQDQASCLRLCESIGRTLPDDELALLDFSATLALRRETFSWRQSVVGRNKQELLQALKTPRRPREKAGSNQHPSSVILICTGQGSQYLRMGMDLAQAWPRFSKHFRHCLDVFLSQGQLDVLAAIDPSRAEDEALLDQTLYTQAALFSLEWALGQSWIESGLKVKGLVGHSIGEVAAACLASVLTLNDAVKLVVARAQAMQSAPSGRMLAVRADWETIKSQLHQDLSLAAINGPQAVVIAGPEEAIRITAEHLRYQGIGVKELATSHAFHSPMMDGILKEFHKVFATITLHSPRIPILSTVTGRELTEEEATDPQYWVQQIRKPVLFGPAIASLSASGTLCLEIGPRDSLTRLIQRIHRDDSIQALACLDTQRRSETESLADVIAELWNDGHQLFSPDPRPVYPAPVYPFYGERLWLEPQTQSQTERRSPNEPALEQQAGQTAFMEKLQGRLADLSGIRPEQLEPTRTWAELGLDSLLLMQWGLRIQRDFQIDMNLTKLQSNIPHLQALVQHILELKPELCQDTQATVQAASSIQDRKLPPSPQLDTSELTAQVVARITDQQLEIMRQQLELLRRLAPNAKFEVIPQPVAAATHVPPDTGNLLEGLEVEGTYNIYTDDGWVAIPRYRGSFLIKDERGQPVVYLPDPTQPGMYLQMIT